MKIILGLYQQIIDELLIQATRSSNDEKDFCDIVYQVADLDSSLSVDVDKILEMKLGITQKDKNPIYSYKISKDNMKSFYYKREGITEPKDEKRKKFDTSTLSDDLQELSSETAISGFNDMSQNIKVAQRLAKQEQTMEDSIWGKDDEGWGVDDDW